MAFQSKTPPIKLTLDESFYNLLIETLQKNESIEIDSTGEKAIKLKEKLLKYSVPYTDEETNKNIVRLAFFPSEASNLIDQLLIFTAVNVDLELNTDYYSVLKKVREKNKQDKEE